MGGAEQYLENESRKYEWLNIKERNGLGLLCKEQMGGRKGGRKATAYTKHFYRWIGHQTEETPTSLTSVAFYNFSVCTCLRSVCAAEVDAFSKIANHYLVRLTGCPGLSDCSQPFVIIVSRMPE